MEKFDNSITLWTVLTFHVTGEVFVPEDFYVPREYDIIEGIKTLLDIPATITGP